MATISFNKSFEITRKETLEKLEKASEYIKPIQIDSDIARDTLKRSESKLLNIFRSRP